MVVNTETHHQRSENKYHWRVQQIGHLNHSTRLRTIMEEEMKSVRAKVQGGPKWEFFWTWLELHWGTHSLCGCLQKTRPVCIVAWGWGLWTIGSRCLLGEEELVSFRCTAPGRLIMLQWLVPHSQVSGQHKSNQCIKKRGARKWTKSRAWSWERGRIGVDLGGVRNTIRILEDHSNVSF